MFNHSLDFGVAYISPVQTVQFAVAGLEQHVAVAEQGFGSALIDDDA